MEQETNTISWSALEYEEQDRHPDWIWYVGLITLVVSVLGFFYKDFFFGIFSIITGTTIIILSFHKPKILDVTLTDHGIQINEQLIEYKNIEGFWLDETNKKDKLLLLVKGSFVPMLVIPLEGVRAEDVKNYLKSFSQEKEIKESVGVKILERLGF